jgi:hypothetical protein
MEDMVSILKIPFKPSKTPFSNPKKSGRFLENLDAFSRKSGRFLIYFSRAKPLNFISSANKKGLERAEQYFTIPITKTERKLVKNRQGARKCNEV